MPEQPRLAGGARPRTSATAGTPAAEVRVTLTPPGSDPLALFGTHAAGVVTLSHDYPDLAVAPGWAVTGRGFAGVVKSVDGRTLTLGPAPDAATPPAEADDPPPAPRRRK